MRLLRLLQRNQGVKEQFLETPQSQKGIHVKVIVGLGNFGDKYKRTRHNVGFLVVDELSKKYHIPVKGVKYKAAFGKGIIGDIEVMIVKPLTFMNLSGGSVKKFLYKFSINTEDLLVVHDEIDLSLGRVKNKKGGSDAGHRGVRSIIQSINTKDFSRIRIGIGRPVDNTEITDWVLTPFLREEKTILKESINQAIQKIEDFLN